MPYESERIKKLREEIGFTQATKEESNAPFAERIRQVRETMGLTQNEMSKRLGISRVSLTHYEAGNRTPDVEFLTRLHKETGVSLYYLLGLSDSRDDALATAQRDTGLSEEALHVLSERVSARFVVNRILTSEDLDYFARAAVRYQMHAANVITYDWNSREMIDASRAAEQEAAVASDAVKSIFGAKSEADVPPGDVLDELQGRGYTAMLKEAENILQAMTDEQYQEALEALREIVSKKEAPDAQETPEQ